MLTWHNLLNIFRNPPRKFVFALKEHKSFVSECKVSRGNYIWNAHIFQHVPLGAPQTHTDWQARENTQFCEKKEAAGPNMLNGLIENKSLILEPLFFSRFLESVIGFYL